MRLFAGMDIPLKIQNRLVEVQREISGVARFRVVPPELWHITLYFAGETDALRVQALCQAVRDTAAEFAPIRIAFTHGAVFGNCKRGIAALLVRQTDEIGGLQRALERHLTCAGWPAESRAYRPHVTLGRDGSFESPGALDGIVTDAAYEAEGITLWESTRIGGALVYRPLYYAPFEKS